MAWYWYVLLLILGAFADYTWFRYFFPRDPLPGPWICPDCLRKNDNERNVCDLCERPRPPKTTA